ncbi:HEXXH motif-containing putative peptide modification protein [Streptomyces sp. NPDC006134]|uniref:aKG-HExxH-type peptide beta-hydroxylase n=1 Tax=Streptomyces sp. NPDC006134 TaxID=3154467 RepID=UPI00340391C9
MTPVPVLPAVVTELAGTRPRPRAVAALRAGLHARRLLLLKALLVRVERLGARTAASAARRDFERDWRLLEQAERTDAAAVRDVVDYPMTGAWLAEALAAPEGPAFEEHLAHFHGVAVAAALRAGRAVDPAPAPSRALVLPGLGVLVHRAGRIRLSGAARGTVTDGEGREVPGWTALRTLPGGGVVLDDLDPYRVPPQGIGPAGLPAAERPRSAHRLWARRWREAHALLSVTDPGRAAETGAVLRAVVPLAHSGADGAMSATLRAAPGAVLAQLPGDAEQLAEALVHEVHHTKLAALQELVPLCRPGGAAVHRVGWRTDPRPVPGVLHGAYAHLALTDLWWRAHTGPAVPRAWRRRAGEQFDKHRDQVGAALSILRESDELTRTGVEFVREMDRCHARLGVAAPGSR